MTIPEIFARRASYLLGGMLIITAVWQIAHWLSLSLITVGQLVAGIGILYGRRWAYYLTYAIAFSNLLVLLAPSMFRTLPLFVPFSGHLASALRFIDVPPLLTVTLINLSFVGALAWTQWRLRDAERVDYPRDSVHKRRWLRALQILSALAVVVAVPILALAAFLLMNPEPNSPGSMGGGFVAVIVFVYGIPIAGLGLIGFFVTRHILIRMDRSRSSSPAAPDRP